MWLIKQRFQSVNFNHSKCSEFSSFVLDQLFVKVMLSCKEHRLCVHISLTDITWNKTGGGIYKW